MDQYGEWGLRADGSGAYYANSPLAVGQRTADGALMLILAAMRGMTPQVS